jgi:thiamine pyridinylase
MLRLPAGVIGILLAFVVATANGDESKTTLRVSLFKYVPTPDGIEEVVRKRWNERFPDVNIEFVKWDGYKEDPPADLDVFEFDSIMLEYFVRNNFVSPLRLSDVEARGDLFEFALRGSMVDGVCYAVPRIACTPMVIYRKGDTAIQNAKSIGDLHDAIGDSTSDDPKPPKNKGLMIDLTGGTTCACFYLDGVADKQKAYSAMPSLPDADHLDKTVLANLKLLTRMAGKKHATCEDCWDKRGPWFAEGYGRAFVGWSERLATIPAKAHKDICVKALPLAEANSVNLFFIDALAINSLLEGRKLELALEFINLAASRPVVIEALLVKEKATGNPQYLLPVRKSVIRDKELLKAAPLYADLASVLSDNPRTFRIGANVRQWLDATKKQIQMAITNP